MRTSNVVTPHDGLQVTGLLHCFYFSRINGNKSSHRLSHVLAQEPGRPQDGEGNFREVDQSTGAPCGYYLYQYRPAHTFVQHV
jgi:hypothetical protein